MVFTTLYWFKYAFCNPPAHDNFIYKLSYRWTVLLLIAFSIVVSIKLRFGDSFVCTSNESFSYQYANAKCYDNIYTEPASLITEESSFSEIKPSVEKFRIYVSYYPWVNLLFLVQAINFYLPHLCWKSYENGYIRRMTAGVQKFFDNEEKRCLELCYLAKYFLVTHGKHKLYTYLYLFFESCNCAIALMQTVWLVHFFNVIGVPDSIPFTLDSWSDFRDFYFPQEGLCDVSTNGKSSTILCLMPMNRLYMYMFIFLHWWYVFIMIATGIVLVYRTALLAPSLRVFVARSTAPLVEHSVLKSLCHRISYSDWFFLTRLCRSMTDIDFGQMLDKIVLVSQQKNVDDKLSLFDEQMKEFDSIDDESIS